MKSSLCFVAAFAFAALVFAPVAGVAADEPEKPKLDCIPTGPKTLVGVEDLVKPAAKALGWLLGRAAEQFQEKGSGSVVVKKPMSVRCTFDMDKPKFSFKFNIERVPRDMEPRLQTAVELTGLAVRPGEEQELGNLGIAIRLSAPYSSPVGIGMYTGSLVIDTDEIEEGQFTELPDRTLLAAPSGAFFVEVFVVHKKDAAEVLEWVSKVLDQLG